MVKWTSNFGTQKVTADGTEYTAKAPPPPTQEFLQKLPYHINRTKAQGLPIYEIVKSHNKRLTKIRRIVGDIEILKRDIQRELQVADKDIQINYLTKQIIVKVRF